MNKGIFFLLVITVFSVFYVRPWTTTENVVTPEPMQYNMCNPDYSKDYEIDLKFEGYVIVDEFGNCHWVEFGELENYLTDLNL